MNPRARPARPLAEAMNPGGLDCLRQVPQVQMLARSGRHHLGSTAADRHQASCTHCRQEGPAAAQTSGVSPPTSAQDHAHPAQLQPRPVGPRPATP